MTEYITIAQVDGLLGSAWTTEDKKARAVLMANTWLTERLSVTFTDVPDAVVQAGAEIAQLAASGGLYAAQEREATSTSVTAGPVQSSKTFKEGSKALSAAESFALALIRPWAGSSQIRLVRG
ncbi:hypothetical protein [Stutzerimonas stutzeri]|uniref:Protein singed n=1 Tax=Stutzerimonas stutzeri KOS6 TaxID=1218352 RepID=A0A061JMF2_STUST|nr:hypothetical protein [Stutzerimonas stutzeri]EWC39550.1 hypothetical protein B597_019360 [Stutzerimonas stutzeri KOS6]